MIYDTIQGSTDFGHCDYLAVAVGRRKEMSVVYVRWYGKVMKGELLDGETMGMCQVRIPLDGHHPIALFTPGHVYQTADHPDLREFDPRAVKKETFEVKISTPSDIMPADDRQMIEAFKRENWDTERNHLRIDKLDEFYKLWRMVTTPFGFVEAEAVQRKDTPRPTPPAPKTVSKNTAKPKQLSLFD